MTPERHRQVMDLFDRACELSGSARIELLSNECAGDPELRREVESLLAHHDLPSTVADRAAEGVWIGLGDDHAVAAEHADPRPLPPRIGTYRPIRVLGTGSMGIVYEAAQERPARRVAVKVLHGHNLPTELVLRFEREAELLGRMHHPGIAQVLEAGAHEGVPFLAMELVNGVPFDVRVRGLERKTVLELLACVCDAVQHAHENGVVHRDLKPSNVLVDEQLRPKVLDFGIARLTDPDARSRTLQTATGQLVGTLEYMSPEQLGESPDLVGPRSDVYALGVMLYQALTRSLPHDLGQLSFAMSVLRLRNDEARRIESLDPSLRGDVATIVHTAIAADPTRRYPSAAALAADLRRHLADEPIVARPPSTLYVLHKFARRHRVLVGAAATTLLALVGGLSLAVVAWRKASTERDRAAAARDESDAVTRFLVRAIEAANPEDGTNRSVRDLLDGLAPAIGIENARRPRVEARLALAAGASYLGLGEPDRASALLTSARSAAERSGELGEDLRLEIEAGLAKVDLLNGRFEASLARLDQLVAQGESVLGASHPLTVAMIEQRGHAHERLGNFEATAKDLARVLAARTATAEDDPFALATTRMNVGLVKARLGKHEEALTTIEGAIGDLRAGGSGRHPFVASALIQVAELRMHAGKLDAAEAACTESLELQRAIFERPQPGIADALTVLARVKHNRGKDREAVDLMKQALAQREALLPADHPDLVATIHKLGEFQLAIADLAAAEATLTKGMQRVPVEASDKAPRGWMLDVYGRMLAAKGDFASAETALREAVERITAARGDQHEDVLVVTSNLGLVLYQAGKYEEALAIHGRILTARERAQPADHPDLVRARQNVGLLEWQVRNLARAQELFHAARESSVRTFGKGHPGTLDLALLEAKVLRRQGRGDEAAPLLATVRDAAPGSIDRATAADVGIELAHLAADRRDGKRATRLVKDVKALGLTDPTTVLNLRIVAARVAALTGATEDAERELVAVTGLLASQPHLKGGSEHLDAWRALIEVHEQKGDTAGAEALRANPPARAR